MINATVRCPYCEAVCVLQGTEREFITCSCESTWIVRYPDGDEVHIGVKSLVNYIGAPPAPLPAEEAAARLNVASLVDRVTEIERRLTVFDADSSGAALARKLGAYLRERR